jgi:hypothetical protein
MLDPEMRAGVRLVYARSMSRPAISLIALLSTGCPSAPAPARPGPDPAVSVPAPPPASAPVPSSSDEVPVVEEAGAPPDAKNDDVEACLSECRKQSNECDDQARKPSTSSKGRRGLRQCGCAKISCEQGCKKDGVPFFACR